MTRYGLSIAASCLVALCFVIVGCSTPRGPMVVDPDAPTEFTTTDSGLKYKILRRGSGDRPSPSDTVEVDYTGWLDDQTIFDSSYNRARTAEFQLSSVVPGWTEGLQFVSEGGMIELEIPAELAYGAAGKPGIPPNSTLHFKVELHDIR